MRQRGADGANLDIESLPSADWPAFAGVVTSLRAKARKDNPIARISVATYPNAAGAKMAKMATDAGADRIFIMAYNYRTALANPVGSTDPLLRADGGLSLTTTLDNYASHGVPAGRILLGLPFYGMTWPTVDETPERGSSAGRRWARRWRCLLPLSQRPGRPADRRRRRSRPGRADGSHHLV